MTVRTSAGSSLSIAAAAPATFDPTGYAALTWILVGEVTDLGEFGRTYNLVTHNPLATRATRKFKGSYNEGSIPVQLGLDNDDAGQNLMEDASRSDDAYSFMVKTQDGTPYYFQAMVMTWNVGIGGVDQITGASSTIELTSNSEGVGVVRGPTPA